MTENTYLPTRAHTNGVDMREEGKLLEHVWSKTFVFICMFGKSFVSRQRTFLLVNWHSILFINSTN